MTSTPRPRTRRAKASTKSVRPKKKPGRAVARRGGPPRIAEIIRQHPFAVAAVAVGAAALLVAALTSLPKRPARKGAGRVASPTPLAALLPLTPRPRPPRTHDVGAADLEFTTSRPGDRDVAFRFSFKKRPVDADETDWPTDRVGFATTRRQGRRTAFTFTRKTRPVPAQELVLRNDQARPGLGLANLELVVRHADGKDFKLIWTKVPPENSRAAMPAVITKPA